MAVEAHGAASDHLQQLKKRSDGLSAGARESGAEDNRDWRTMHWDTIILSAG